MLVCRAYVDLNPIRAGLADDLAGSHFTTAQRRLRTLAERPDEATAALYPLAGTESNAGPGISTTGYVELVDSTARMA